MIFVHKINTWADFVTAQAAIPADKCLPGHYDSLILTPFSGISGGVLLIGRENTCEPCGDLLPDFLNGH
ncbi:hypothetical protein, partial [Salmonella enterica]